MARLCVSRLSRQRNAFWSGAHSAQLSRILDPDHMCQHGILARSFRDGHFRPTKGEQKINGSRRADDIRMDGHLCRRRWIASGNRFALFLFASGHGLSLFRVRPGPPGQDQGTNTCQYRVRCCVSLKARRLGQIIEKARLHLVSCSASALRCNAGRCDLPGTDKLNDFACPAVIHEGRAEITVFAQPLILRARSVHSTRLSCRPRPQCAVPHGKRRIQPAAGTGPDPVRLSAWCSSSMAMSTLSASKAAIRRSGSVSFQRRPSRACIFPTGKSCTHSGALFPPGKRHR